MIFKKRSSLMMCTEQGARPLAQAVEVFAQNENLDAHARSAGHRV